MVDLKTNTVTTVAGNGKKGVPEDGAEAVKAPLVDDVADADIRDRDRQQPGCSQP